MKLTIITVLFTVSYASALQHGTSTSIKNGTFALNDLGIVNGKHYYSEISIKRTWDQAQQFCRTNGLQLATIETASEASHLAEMYYGNTMFRYGHWINARDSQTPGQYAYESNGQPLSDYTFLEWRTFIDPLTCVYYESAAAPHLRPYNCDALILGVLCQA